MIRRIEALRYRSLRYVAQDISPFNVLVGPNASGKSALFDAVGVVSDALRLGPRQAMLERSPDVQALVWMREGHSFEVALHLAVPEERRHSEKLRGFGEARYEVKMGTGDDGELSVLAETLWLVGQVATPAPRQVVLFPSPPPQPEHLVLAEGQRAPPGWKKVVTKKSTGNDYFMSETTGWNSPFRLGPRRLALANLPEDEERFPIATWVRRVLVEGVQRVFLNSEAMHRPSPPGSPTGFLPDGSNLPWVIRHLRATNTSRFDLWVEHVRTALPDVRDIDTVERPEDRHCYLKLRYSSGATVPSWLLSDGTIRLLALTLLAYVEPAERVYLIEEPENGMHPAAVETVFQSLSSVYDAQVLCASHSPVFLSLAEPRDLLCLARTADGATDVIRGDQHPQLRDWRKETDVGTLLATGILG